MVFQSFNLFPHLTVLQNLTIAQTKVLALQQGRGREGRAAQPGAGRHDATRRTPSRRSCPAASSSASRSPGRCRWTRADALRRAHLGARPRAGRRGARRHEVPGRGGHDDDGRHPRDGLRPRGRRPRGLHGRRLHRRGGRRRRTSSATPRRSGPSRSSTASSTRSSSRPTSSTASQKNVGSWATTRSRSSTSSSTFHLSTAVQGWEMPNPTHSPAASTSSGGTSR